MSLPKEFLQDGEGRDPQKRRLRKRGIALIAGPAALVLCAMLYWLVAPYGLTVVSAPGVGATRESRNFPDQPEPAEAPAGAEKSNPSDTPGQEEPQPKFGQYHSSRAPDHAVSGETPSYASPPPPLSYARPPAAADAEAAGAAADNAAKLKLAEAEERTQLAKKAAADTAKATASASSSPAVKPFAERELSEEDVTRALGSAPGTGNFRHRTRALDASEETQTIPAWAPLVVENASSGISRYANFDGPETVEVGQPFPIVFVLKEQLTEEEKRNQASVKTEPDAGSALTREGKLALKLDHSKEFWDIDVDLTATGFVARDGRWTGRIRLPRHGDSEKVRFVLTPRAGTLGQKWMTLRLWHEGQALGSVSRPVEVEEHVSPGAAIQPAARAGPPSALNRW